MSFLIPNKDGAAVENPEIFLEAPDGKLHHATGISGPDAKTMTHNIVPNRYVVGGAVYSLYGNDHGEDILSKFAEAEQNSDQEFKNPARIYAEIHRIEQLDAQRNMGQPNPVSQAAAPAQESGVKGPEDLLKGVKVGSAPMPGC